MAKLLVVDDDFDVAEVIGALLELKGHEVRIAHSAFEGILALRSLAPDCLLLDVDMPVQDGPAMAHEMLVHDAGDDEIPIVLVSNRVDLAAIAARMGTPYFLTKTGGSEELARVLDQALVERRVPRPPGAPDVR